MCDHCKDELPLAGDFVTCPSCSRKLHYQCTTVTERSWRSMGSKRDIWRCQFCRNANENPCSTPYDSSARPITPDIQANKRNRPESSPQNNIITQRATENPSYINTNTIMAELQNFKTEIKNIADFCNFVSQKFDEINKNIEKNNTFNGHNDDRNTKTKRFTQRKR